MSLNKKCEMDTQRNNIFSQGQKVKRAQKAPTLSHSLASLSPFSPHCPLDVFGLPLKITFPYGIPLTIDSTTWPKAIQNKALDLLIAKIKSCFQLCAFFLWQDDQIFQQCTSSPMLFLGCYEIWHSPIRCSFRPKFSLDPRLLWQFPDHIIGLKQLWFQIFTIWTHIYRLCNQGVP